MQVGIKGLSYALQSPSREMLYIVTTDAIKFKAKSWIDVFGGHAAKALGCTWPGVRRSRGSSGWKRYICGPFGREQGA